ncbi:hypothetical protein [Streptomyces sp. NPDC056452]|uniref:hypothetical protein n=1 Tax=Streptomyces sp. NPDC056452 TaxID=3345821 RepID=UPI0036A04688
MSGALPAPSADVGGLVTAHGRVRAARTTVTDRTQGLLYAVRLPTPGAEARTPHE